MVADALDYIKSSERYVNHTTKMVLSDYLACLVTWKNTNKHTHANLNRKIQCGSLLGINNLSLLPLSLQECLECRGGWGEKRGRAFASISLRQAGPVRTVSVVAGFVVLEVGKPLSSPAKETLGFTSTETI